MTVRLNPSATLLALAIIQPASALEVASFLQKSLLHDDNGVDVAEVEALLMRWRDVGKIVRVHNTHGLHALTSSGNHSLTKEMRHLRDRTRLFLLKDIRSDKLQWLEKSNVEWADASSADANGIVSQEEQRPIIGPAPRRQAPRRVPNYWPLLGKQLLVGSLVDFSSSPRFRFGSFPTLRACQESGGNPMPALKDFTITDLALGIGISPRMISSFLFNKAEHYREFRIPKKSGGERIIHAPRVMVKTVQYWVLDHLLYKLPVHPSCTSYQKGTSIYDNAYIHTKSRFVCNFDIESFFSSITIEMVLQKLLLWDFGRQSALLLSKLLTFDGALPQGAPTSPIISNAMLFDFDKEMSEYCDQNQLTYSRYADDVTLSGGDHEVIVAAVAFAEVLLNASGFRLNKKKTRIAGRSSRQVVTGLVVNEIAQPSREYRRNVRAMFHNAIRDPHSYDERWKELGGHLSYLLSFPNIRSSNQIKKYMSILKSLRAPD